MGTKSIDLLGRRVKTYTVISFAGKGKQNVSLWHCECDCGQKVIRRTSTLMTGCVRCKCQNLNLTGKRVKTFTVIGLAERSERNRIRWHCVCDCGLRRTYSTDALINENARCKCQRLPPGEKAFRQLLSQYKRGATNRRFEFSLSRAEFTNLVKSNCHYCDKKPSQVSKYTHNAGTDVVIDIFTYNGIDRKDNSLGYTLDNTVTCCGVCNMSKGTTSYEEFLDWIKSVYNHRVAQNTRSTIQLSQVNNI